MRTAIGLTCAVAFLLILFGSAGPVPAADPVPSGQLAFKAEGKEYRFDTGALRGTLRKQGRSMGLSDVTDVASGTPLAGGLGLVSHYRLLDADTRYGTAAWDWASTAQLLPDGAVETRWSADQEHPFEMKAVYRWKAPNVLDVETSVVAKKPLRRFEVFLASYFAGFPQTFAYTEGCPATGGTPGLMEAKKEYAPWQTFPRDDATAAIYADGRWKRPPHPVEWKIMPRLAMPLAVRQDEKSGLTAMLMAPSADCFAISMPYGEEGHRSVYLSLFGRDLTEGQTAVAHARLVVGRKIMAAEAAAIYQDFVRSLNP